jgi:hypothetical protein
VLDPRRRGERTVIALFQMTAWIRRSQTVLTLEEFALGIVIQQRGNDKNSVVGPRARVETLS